MSSNPEPSRLPTLTEVVATEEAAEADARTDAAAQAAVAEVDEARLSQRVLAGLEQQIDLMLEYRLRDALAPALARASDTLIREMRVELASTLRDVVARAVAQELEKHRSRSG
jgi:hypothetical protein